MKDTKYFLLNVFLQIDSEIPSKALRRSWAVILLFMVVKPPPRLPCRPGRRACEPPFQQTHLRGFQVCGLWQTRLLRCCVDGWLPRRRLGRPWQEGRGVSHAVCPEDAFEGFAICCSPMHSTWTPTLSEPIAQEPEAFWVLYLELSLSS